ncbi:hypothetical protein DFA_05323 [Cavenderia fasciculata]|uniref:Uncharacterized protein n=1 Tax=Cavenderia fasciculata TaxID=261658 RepID=F4PKW9_CACFS|nr:uncharacterized protein DFA_05323 [Cavenderia fasciculata]EGG23191.1 hypothetical protein DFA_05323 [Cavenderia fasciculata]|eukprot:XP_004361042.1 hypothetical protein DFA_05323 [Cavenderia fasciculata]
MTSFLIDRGIAKACVATASHDVIKQFPIFHRVHSYKGNQYLLDRNGSIKFNINPIIPPIGGLNRNVIFSIINPQQTNNNNNNSNSNSNRIDSPKLGQYIDINKKLQPSEDVIVAAPSPEEEEGFKQIPPEKPIYKDPRPMDPRETHPHPGTPPPNPNPPNPFPIPPKKLPPDARPDEQYPNPIPI